MGLTTLLTILVWQRYVIQAIITLIIWATFINKNDPTARLENGEFVPSFNDGRLGIVLKYSCWILYFYNGPSSCLFCLSIIIYVQVIVKYYGRCALLVMMKLNIRMASGKKFCPLENP